MYKQLDYWRQSQTMTRGQTYRLDLPKSGLLSSIFLNVSGACVSGASLADEKWRLQDFLGLVEVIGNGATVIKSLDWKNAEYLHWLRNKSNPLNAWRNYATNTQFEYLPLFFGRYLWDREYGLDLSKWDNVEIRITNSASATFYGADLSVTLLNGYWRDMPGGFTGYLRTEKWREWTTVQDQTQYFLLPTDYPITGLHLRALPHTTTGGADSNGANNMYDITFQLNGGQKDVFVGHMADLALQNYFEIGGSLLSPFQVDVNAGRAIGISQLRTLGWAAGASSATAVGAATDATISRDQTDGTINMVTREADHPIEGLALGYGYQHSAYLWHSQECNADELLDPAQAGEMRLNIHTRNSATAVGGTNQVILERKVTR